MIGLSDLKTGLGGSFAMSTQITLFYWLKTTTTYQYKTGISTSDAFKYLYNTGGFRRFYNGCIPSLIMGTSCRFGDVISYKYLEKQNHLSQIQKSSLASLSSMVWRINLMPLDTLDHMLQAHGKKGIHIIKDKVKNQGPSVLYYGGLAWSVTNFVGYIGWFYTYSLMEKYNSNNKIDPNIYSVIEGFTCTSISDIITNPIRVLKTYRQTSPDQITYYQTYKKIVNEFGLSSLLLRGLKTRIIMHGIQNSLFVILWKKFDSYIEDK